MGVNVVHIFNSRNTHLNPGIIEGIEKHKRKDDKHRFYISFINPRKLKDEKQIYGRLGEGKLDIYSIYSIFDYMKAILSNNDVIVLHGLLSPFRKQLMLFVFIRLFFCKVFRKINLVAWGGGDFELRKFKLIDRLHFKLVNRINKVLTLSHADKERYEKIYRKQAIVIAYFTINVNLRETVGERVSDITKIMISHSGWSFLNHPKSFSLLEPKFNENMEVICPLAYGDEDYIKEVTALGCELFGDKFGYFTELKDKDEYERLLSDIDVFMTYADIQTGLYAVTSCLANGAKVYCRSNLYYSLTQYGFKVFDIDSLTILPPAEFSTIAKSDQIKNRNAYFQNYKNFTALEERWGKVYDLCV